MLTTNKNQDKHNAPGTSSQPAISAEKLLGIRHIIAVGSGKCCVGKSTVSVNLGLARQQLVARVWSVDADILGARIPGMLGIPTGAQPGTTQHVK